MEDPMISIDRRKLRVAIIEEFRTLASFYIYLESNQEIYGKGFSRRNIEKILATGEVRKSMLNSFAEVLKKSFDEFYESKVVPWDLHHRVWDGRWRPPGSLLQAEFEVVPFEFRYQELDELKNWCNNRGAHHTALRLFTGAGGMGKTRLAIEFCRHMQKDGWRAGFLDYNAFREDEQRWGELLSECVPLLLVFDYAEHHLEQLSWLLPVIMARKPDNVELRLLLLARDAKEWWTILKSRKDAGDLLLGGTSFMHALKPLTSTSHDRSKSWLTAAEAFAKRLDKPVCRPPANLDESFFDRVLLLHMSALAAIEGANLSGKEAVLDYVLLRERRFWSQHLKAMDLPATFLDGLGQFMAFVTMKKGIATRESGIEYLRSFTYFNDLDNHILNALNQMLSECYPGPNWIEPIQPDLLGDRLISVAFEDDQFRTEALALVHSAKKQKDPLDI